MSNYFIYFYAFCVLLSLFLLIYLVNNDGSPSLKIPWIILMLVLPILGGIAYVCFGRTPVRKKEKDCMIELVKRSQSALSQLPDASDLLKQEAPLYAGQSHYIEISASPILIRIVNICLWAKSCLNVCAKN